MRPEIGLPLPGDRLREGALAVAVHAAHSEDLAAADRERYARDAGLKLVPAGGRVDELEPGLVRQRPADVDDADSSISSRSSAMLAAGSSCSPNISPTIIRWSCSGVDVRSTSGSMEPTTRPALSTTTRSPMAVASWSLWVMKMIASPDAFRPTRTFSSSAMPCGVSIEVGSSRMRTREPFQRALMISTCCCWPSARLPARESGSSWTPSVPDSSASLARALASSRTRPRFDPSMRFSSTDSVGMRERCW